MQVDCRAEDHPNWYPVVCRVYTEEGIFGDGDSALAFGVGHTAVYAIMQEYAAKIIGMDPLQNEVIWEKLYKETFWGQNGGPVTFAGLSALDIALWDIRGKYYNTPVYMLLGGKFREKLRCYASQLQLGWGAKRKAAFAAEEYAENARRAVSEGYDAVKVDLFTYAPDGHTYTPEETCGPLTKDQEKVAHERLSAIRNAVGPDVDIIIENHAVMDVQGAVRLGRLAEPYDIMYLEEPTTPNVKMTKLVSERISIPIAMGERLYSRWQYAPYFEDGSVSMIQPDLANCGGLTEAKKICDMAHVYDVGVQAHICSSPISAAAALQLEAAIPHFVIHEQHGTMTHAYNRKLCVYDYQPENGFITIPDRPGIGNELSDYCFHNGKIVTVGK